MAKIGVQAMMLKDSVAEIGAFETLRKVSAIGYHAVEISQIPMTPDNVTELDQSRTEFGMDIAALSVMLPLTALDSVDTVIDFAKQANEYAARLHEQGIDLYYHNHHVEFAKTEGK